MARSRSLVFRIVVFSTALLLAPWFAFATVEAQEDPEPPALVADLEGHDGPVLKAAFSPDGRWLASAGHDGRLRIWSTEEWSEVADLETTGRHLWCVTFSPKGRYLAAAGDSVIVVWAVGPRWKEVKRLAAPQPRLTRSGMRAQAIIFDLAFSPDGRLLAAATQHTTVPIWETKRWKALPPIDGHAFPASQRPQGRPTDVLDVPMVQFVDFSPDGRRLVTGVKTEATRVWGRPRKGKWKRLLDHRDAANAHRMWARFSPDGKLLAVGGTDGRVEIFHGRTMKRVHAASVYSGAFVSGLAFMPDGRHLLTAGDDLRILDVESWGEVGRYDPGEWLTFVAVSPDGRFLATVGGRRELRVHDLGKIIPSS